MEACSLSLPSIGRLAGLSTLDRWADSYDKLADVVGFRVELYEAGEVADHAEESVQSTATRESPIHGLAAWLTSLLHPAPAPQVRRRHA